MKNKYLTAPRGDETIFGYFPPEQDIHNFEQYLKKFPKSKYLKCSYENRPEEGAGTVSSKLKAFCFLLISIPVTIGLFFL